MTINGRSGFMVLNAGDGGTFSRQGLRVRNVRIDLRPSTSSYRACRNARLHYPVWEGCTGFYPVEIGRNVLKRLRMYFAMKERVLYFSKADASSMPE